MTDPAPRFTFHRPDLARSLADALAGTGLVDARSGLFLAAPRRTGKSTFLTEDLMPEIRHHGWLPVYADLWADRARDPALLIADAIKTSLRAHEGVIARMAKSAGVEKISVLQTFVLDLKRAGLPDGVTLTDTLGLLCKAAKKPVVLIVDEAQHALSSEAGIDAMFALKSARDQLNRAAADPQLHLVLTGSNRDKLAHLVLNRTQPFFGSTVTTFPLLDRAFTDALTAWINKKLAAGNQFDPSEVFGAFKLVGHRPEMLRTIIAEIALDMGQAQQLGKLLKKGAANWRDRVWGEIESEFSALTDVQQTVLTVLIESGSSYSPFAEAAMQAYAALLGKSAFTSATVQSALDALREKNLIWRAGRGAYALEDENLTVWYKDAKARGRFKRRETF